MSSKDTGGAVIRSILSPDKFCDTGLDMKKPGEVIARTFRVYFRREAVRTKAPPTANSIGSDSHKYMLSVFGQVFASPAVIQIVTPSCSNKQKLINKTTNYSTMTTLSSLNQAIPSVSSTSPATSSSTSSASKAAAQNSATPPSSAVVTLSQATPASPLQIYTSLGIQANA